MGTMAHVGRTIRKFLEEDGSQLAHEACALPNSHRLHVEAAYALNEARGPSGPVGHSRVARCKTRTAEQKVFGRVEGAYWNRHCAWDTNLARSNDPVNDKLALANALG